MIRRIIIAVVIVAAAAAGAFYWLYQRAPADEKTLLVSGNIEAHQSLVSFKDVQSQIVELPFNEGQWVNRGDLIAKLDDSHYRQQVAIDEAALKVQEQQLASARQNLEAAHDTVINDQADLAQKDADSKRYQKLWEADAASTQVRDLSRTAIKQARAAWSRDQALEEAARRNIATGEANIKNAQETLKLAKLMLGYTVLTAPFSGVILVRQTELGEVMQPGTPVVTLADLDHVWLRAYISETDLGRVRWDQPATVTTDSYPGRRYAGRVSFISSDAEFTPKSVETHKERVTLVYRIKIDVANPNHELKPGMPADAEIQLVESDHRGGGNGPKLTRD